MVFFISVIWKIILLYHGKFFLFLTVPIGKFIFISMPVIIFCNMLKYILDHGKKIVVAKYIFLPWQIPTFLLFFPWWQIFLQPWQFFWQHGKLYYWTMVNSLFPYISWWQPCFSYMSILFFVTCNFLCTMANSFLYIPHDF